MSDAAFRAEQRGVAIRMAAALVVTAGGLALAARYGRAAPLGERLETAAWAVTAALAWLAAAVGDVARRRFLSERDIAGATGTPGTVARARAILQNTLEQVVLAAPLYLLLAVAEPRAIAVIAVMAACFSVGRGLFWAGYKQGPSARALGFALSFYPSLGGLLWLLVVLGKRAL